MKRCEQYQAQLLDHLYGLLEADESLALIEHAGQCDDCRAALLQADSKRKLFAAAAKAEFPAVRFQAPAKEAAVLKMPKRLPAPRTLRSIRRWGIAAAVLLALGAVGIPTGRYVGEFAERRHNVDETAKLFEQISSEERALINNREKQRREAFEALQSAERKRQELEKEQEQRLVQLADEVRRQQMYMVVTGPESIRPGVPNDYRIETKNMRGDKEKARLDITVKDMANGQVVLERKDVPSDGNYTMSLPADVAVKASNQLALEVAARSESGKQKGALTENLTLARSIYVTQLVTDKPMYQPGETVHFRSLTLDRYTLNPAAEDLRLVYILLNAQGKQVPLLENATVAAGGKPNNNGGRTPQIVRTLRVHGAATGRDVVGPNQQPVRGIGAGEFTIPEDTDGGEYTLVVEEAGKKFPPERRKFLINVYQKPRLNKELNFHRSSYNPGDSVIANATVAKAEGGLPLIAQPVLATIRIDGKTYKADGQAAAEGENADIRLLTNPRGEVTVPFKLPAQIERGEASLSVQFFDDANYEPIVRTIPIALKKLQVEFFPEGGDLVAGLPNRVYFQARTMLDKPAEVKGKIVDGTGKVVADAQTLSDDLAKGINQGMGVFEFTPAAGEKYEFQADKPEGKYPLPAVAAEGVLLRVPTGVTTDQQDMTVVVTSARKDRELVIGAYCRGGLLAFQTVKAREDQPVRVQLKPSRGVGGVYRITVFEKLGDKGETIKPVAERLVYRLPAARLNLSVRPDKTQYAPGEKVTLHLSSANETGQPLPTILMVGVVDKSVLKMADEKTARSMPTHFLLTSEVRRAEDLEYADILLGDHPKAPAALDLLLGTQGWRRFLESDPERFDKDRKRTKVDEDLRCKADVDRLRVITGKMTAGKAEEQRVVNTFQLKTEQVRAEFKPKFERLEVELGEAAAAMAAADDVSQFERQQDELSNKGKAAFAAHIAAGREFEDIKASLWRWVTVLLGGVLLFAGIGSLVLGLRRSLPRALPIYATALGAVAVCGLVLAATLVFEGTAPQEPTVAVLATRPANRAEEAAPAMPLNEADADERTLEQRRQADRKGAAKGLGGGGAEPRDGVDKAVDPQRPGAAPVADQKKPNAQQPLADKPQANKRDEAAAFAAPNAPPRLAPKTKQPMAPADQKGEGKQARMLALPAAANQQPPPVQGRGPAMNGAGLERGEQEAVRGANAGDLQLNALRRADLFNKAKEQMEKNGDAAKDLDRMVQQLQAADYRSAAGPSIVREYAHRRTADSGSDLRADFTETLYWHPVLVLANGKADISFDLCDSQTTFQVLAAGHTLDGRLASVTADLEVRKPFSIEAKLPAQVTANDTIDVPVAIANDSDEPRRVHVTMLVNNMELTASSPGANQRELNIPAHQRTRTLFQVKPTVRDGVALITIRGSSEPFGNDAVQYTLKIVPEGFATVESHSDLLEGPAHVEVNLPKQWVKPTLKVELAVYPSTLADLQRGLEAMLREPHGCFEQTSSSNYPNLLILQYLRDTNQNNPQVADRARQLLERGYQKLIAFECQNNNQRQGYEWFGGAAPAHEALTAYGLMEFRDMVGVGQGVDQAMVERTRQYLLSRKDGKGGFMRNPRAIDTFGRAPDHVTNAYIIWAITESDKDAKDDIQRELDALVKQSKDSKDPYFLALVANSLLNRGQHEPAGELLKKLIELQKPDGSLPGAQTSITGSGGRDLLIETTGLTVLAWLKANRPEYFKNVNIAVRWIGQQRGGHGGFGSTQSTILALKALIAYTKGNSKPIQPGTVTLVVNGKQIGTKAFDASLRDALTLTVDNAEELFQAGKNEVQIEMTGKNQFPYTLTWSYSALTPKSPEGCPVRLSAGLTKKTVQDGETVPLNIKVENATDRGQGMAVAIIGLPAGLNLPEDMEQLKNLARLRNDGTEPGVISAWEIRGRELVIYWRQLAPKQKIEFNLDLICRVPGDFRGPASRAYLYYNADHKHWIDPIQAVIVPK